jgi:L-ascorbate metabolism protein UlaG (beta-lactamase superfamily)
VLDSPENDRHHSHLGQIVPPFETLRALELLPDGVVFKRVRIQAIHVFESAARLPEDEVTIVHFFAEGLHIVFLGDLGHSLSETEIAPLRDADIVLAAAGGPPTIAIPDLAALLRELNPRLVIPMHFKTPKINLDIAPLEDFLTALAPTLIERPGESSVTISPSSLPEEQTILVLEHAR